MDRVTIERIHHIAAALAAAQVPDDAVTAGALVAMGVTALVRDGRMARDIDKLVRRYVESTSAERAAQLIERAKRGGP